MLKLIILFIVLFTLFSCESLDEKSKLLELKMKQQEMLENENNIERNILEKKRIKAKILRNKAQEDENKTRNDLLDNDLIAKTMLLNKQASSVLNTEFDSLGKQGEYDILTDNSITKFVNNVTPFSNLHYIPKDLVKINGEYINNIKENSSLRKEAFSGLDNLAQNFYLEFTTNIKVVSAYRSYEYQKGIKNRGCADNLCAKAGYSEHQTGLAVDLWEASTQQRFLSDEKLLSYVTWMKKEAHKYGFTNTYQKGIDIDGYEIEPWHWRYVGKELALILQEYNITFAEYTDSPESY